MPKDISQINGHKVKLVYYDFEGNIAEESVWAEKEGQYYRLKNIPFFAANLAYNDLINVEDDNGELFFDSLIEPSEHSTIQIIFFNIEYFKEVTDHLIKLKCDWEGSHLKQYISVDVPREVNYSEIQEYLSEKHKENILDYREACLSDRHTL